MSVFFNVNGGTKAFICAFSTDTEVCKGLRGRVELVESPIAANPESTSMVNEKFVDVHTAQTTRLAWHMSENFELVAVESIQPVLRAKP
jgi:hypothetical protein